MAYIVEELDSENPKVKELLASFVNMTDPSKREQVKTGKLYEVAYFWPDMSFKTIAIVQSEVNAKLIAEALNQEEKHLLS